MRAIAENAGLDTSPIIHAAREHGEHHTFDVVGKQWVEAYEVGIVDPLPVALIALESAVSAANMALTTEVLIRRKKPSMATNP